MALGEFALIERFFRRPLRQGAGVTLGIGDDAALLELPPGTELVAALDTLVAGHHFLDDASAHSIGYRALAVNLSDIAAMGAMPAWALMGLTLPQADERWLEGFMAGWSELAARHGVELVGGDTTRGPLTVSVQLSGWVERGTALLRGGGRPGDVLVVTGTLGDAAAGLAIARGAEGEASGVATPGVAPSAVAPRVTTPRAMPLETDASGAGTPGAAPPGETAALTASTLAALRAELRRRFEYPDPRVAFGRGARGIASAAMDISDGIAGDLPKLAAAGGLAARVEVARLPLSAALRALVPADQARQWALSGGDDYELMLAVPPTRLPVLQDLAGECGLPLTPIGELCPGAGVTWSMDGAPMPVQPGGYDHFRFKRRTSITV